VYSITATLTGLVNLLKVVICKGTALVWNRMKIVKGETEKVKCSVRIYYCVWTLF
jgi:hypothetical protein